MAGEFSIPDSTLEEIKQRIDLGELIASYGVDVRHAGSSLKACCPFHNEKTPSFSINTARGFYHCFGCGESGDAIKFVQKFEGLSFVEAVKKLAQQCGVEIQSREDPEAGRRKRLYALMAELAAFYRRCLLKTRAAAEAREYLKRRGIDEKTCEDWTIGYAPEGAATMVKWAKKYGFTEEELAEAGVVRLPDRPGDSGYHRFSGRLMFTIRDRQGRVAGFSGRLIKENKKAGKYVNSPETPIFHKSSILFGFDRAQGEISRAKLREAIACEGQIDCIRLHMNGFTTAVASQGTAFTEEHARMLKRVADSAVLMYDDDGAGRKAAIRVAGMLLAMEMPVRVVALPDGDDPDSFLCKHRPEELQARIDTAESIMSFQCRAERAKERNPKSLDAVSRITKAVLATIAQCPSPVLRAAMVGEAAGLLSLPVAALDDELGKAMSAPKPAAKAQTQTEPPPLDEEAPDTAEIYPGDAHKAIPPPPREIALMELLMANERDAEIEAALREFLPPAALSHDFTRRFAATWLEEAATGEDAFAAFAETLDERERDWFDQVLEGAGKPLASSMPVSGMIRENIRGIWKAEFSRRRGALPQDSGDETLIRQLELSNAINRMRQGSWEKAAEEIKNLGAQGAEASAPPGWPERQKLG